jgi:hypothetical protein
MIFRKKININGKIVDINLSNCNYKKKNIFIFGSPLGLSIERINEKNILDQVKDLSGYFFVIVLKKNSIIFITDPISNYRVYYKFFNNKIFVFDNLKITQKFKNHFDKKIFDFFLIKNYTPGNQTFYDKLYKFQPCTIYKYDGEIKKKIYFEKNKNKPSIKKLIYSVENYLDQEALKIKNKNKRNILLFSGGKDSCLIFQNLIKHKISFIPIYLHTIPESKETLKNLNLVKLYCLKFNKKIKIIRINIKQKIPSNFFNQHMLFEYHLSLLHFFGIKQIKKNYGNNILIISGQSCDSILSFGPSQYTVSNFIARFITHFPKSFLSKILIKIINTKFRRKIYKINNLNDFYKSFYFSYFYYPILIDENKKYNFEKQINQFIKKDKNFISNLMYLKCHGFLQGPDNLILINVAKYFKIKFVVMPYASYKFIQIITKYYNFKLDIFIPKYLIDLLLNNYLLVKLKNFIYKKSSNVKLSTLDVELKKKHINYIKNANTK